MTTVVWDGKRLVADSQLTYLESMEKPKWMPKLMHGLRVLAKARFDKTAQCQKIFAPAHWRYEGEQVLAVGMAGNEGIMAWAKRNCAEPEGVVELTQLQCDEQMFYNMIIVLKDHLVVVGKAAGADKPAVYNKVPRIIDAGLLTTPIQLAIGTGMYTIKNMLRAGLDGITLVSQAAGYDLFTGGDLTVWDPEVNGGQVQMGVPRLSRFQAMRKIGDRMRDVGNYIKRIQAGDVPEVLPEYIVRMG